MNSTLYLSTTFWTSKGCLIFCNSTSFHFYPSRFLPPTDRISIEWIKYRFALGNFETISKLWWCWSLGLRGSLWSAATTTDVHFIWSSHAIGGQGLWGTSLSFVSCLRKHLTCGVIFSLALAPLGPLSPLLTLPHRHPKYFQIFLKIFAPRFLRIMEENFTYYSMRNFA